MRTRPIVGTKLWFGPRGWGGWGWTPLSWEGWLALGFFIVATIALSRVAPWSGLPLVAALLVVCELKGTSPGGRKARAELQRQREQHERR